MQLAATDWCRTAHASCISPRAHEHSICAVDTPVRDGHSVHVNARAVPVARVAGTKMNRPTLGGSGLSHT